MRCLSIGFLSVLALGLGSCGSNPSPSESPSTDASEDTTEGELQVVTTFLPMTQFTKAVAGDRAEVEQLMSANTGPHDYQATPEDAQ
ncbi:MAG: metal ABC transporter solute-binding protein, Zn/Mn family, partial [Cyanophyceae cyanobacterium]